MSNSVFKDRSSNQYFKEMNEALQRLYDNKDFQKVVIEGYFNDFAIKQTSLLAVDFIRDNGKRPEVMERLVAISNLQDYLITISNMTVDETDETDEVVV